MSCRISECLHNPLEISKTPPQVYWGKHRNLGNAKHRNGQCKGSEIYISDSLLLSLQQREKGENFNKEMLVFLFLTIRLKKFTAIYQ